MTRTRATDYDDAPWFFGVGTTGGGMEPERNAPVGTLWVPDPEQRHGWREFYVAHPEPKPGANPIGFRKPGQR